MSSASESDGEISVKRRRDEKEWRRNKIKKLKAEGQSHTNWRGNVVPARSTGEACSCKKKCFAKFSAAVREHIILEFNKLGSGGNTVAQDAYLQGLITSRPIKKRRPRKENPGTARRASFIYRIKIGTEEYIVCFKAFCSLHGLKSERVKRLSNLAVLGLTPQEQRGKHNNRPTAVPEAVLNVIDEHIRSFPYKVSHYSGSTKKRRYLSSNLTIRKMYELFLQKHYPPTYEKYRNGKVEIDKVRGRASYRTYLKYFRYHFNYGFGRPQVDKCRTCEELNVKIQNEKNVTIRNKLTTDLKLHKMKAKTFYHKINRCKQLAVENEEVEMITFDYQQNLPVPVTNITDEFYLRQLWVYNFGVHSMSNNNQVMYMYDETVAKKGCSEVVSFLKHFIDNFISQNIRKLYVFSDGCTGQNRNHTLVHFLFTLIRSGRFDYIEQRYPIRGHSYLPNDRDFAKIEIQKRKYEKIETPLKWYDIVENDCKFAVVKVNQSMVYNFKQHFGSIFKKNIVKKGAKKQPSEKFLISAAKIIQYSTAHKNEISVSNTMKGTIWTNFTLLQANTKPTIPTEPMYSSRIPINVKKAKNLEILVGFLSNEEQNFYQPLLEKTTSTESDESESDTELLD